MHPEDQTDTIMLNIALWSTSPYTPAQMSSPPFKRTPINYTEDIEGSANRSFFPGVVGCAGRRVNPLEPVYQYLDGTMSPPRPEESPAVRNRKTLFQQDPWTTYNTVRQSYDSTKLRRKSQEHHNTAVDIVPTQYQFPLLGEEEEGDDDDEQQNQEDQEKEWTPQSCWTPSPMSSSPVTVLSTHAVLPEVSHQEGNRRRLLNSGSPTAERAKLKRQAAQPLGRTRSAGQSSVRMPPPLADLLRVDSYQS